MGKRLGTVRPYRCWQLQGLDPRVRGGVIWTGCKGRRAVILHVDMDAFYAAVEQRDRPELRGKPVIVGGLQGRGVVCAASYEARTFGVRSAMPMVTARRLCPNGVYLPARMSHYAEISRQIRDIFLSFTPLVEPLSLDEAFLDVRGSERLFGPVPEVGRQIKDRIHTETDLTASVGVAPNKFLAKLASDHGKPDGFIVLAEGDIADFLARLPVSRLWGVGPKGEKRLHALGVRMIGDLAALPQEALARQFGETGRHLWRLVHGIDDRPVVPDREAKSISCETTFETDLDDLDLLRRWLFDLVDQVAGRLRRAGLQARTVELKVRSAAFRTRTKSRSLPEPTDMTEVIWQTASDLLRRSLTSDLLPVRLLGVGVARLTRPQPSQKGLYDNTGPDRRSAVDDVVDAIRDQFGVDAIRRGLAAKPPDRRPPRP
jgi:DNA polymerase-4